MKTLPAIAPAPDRVSPASFSGGRRWWARLRLALGLVLLAYILILANIVAFRHPVRFDWTAEGLSSLSQATRDRLALVQEDILVVIPTYLQSQNQEHIAHHEVLARARALLLEYCALQPRIKIAAEVNVFSRPERWVEVKTRFDLDDSQLNRFIFFLGSSLDMRQSVTPQDLAVLGKPRDPAIAVPQILAFRGEKAMTDAILRLIERRQRPVYFLQGHGELSLRPEGGGDAGPGGIAAVLHELRTEGMDPRELSLLGSREVPGDCTLLVAAGPQQDYSKAELEAIERYLGAGGRLLVTLGARRTTLDGLLSRWGIQPVAGKINGRMVLPGTSIATTQIPVRSFHRGHAVTRVFTSVPRFEMRLVAPCPLESGALERNLDATPLLSVSSQEGESFYLVPDRKDEALPKPGNFDLAVAVEQRAPERPPPGFQRLETRILAVGGSSFLLDQYFLTGSHRDFLLNGIAWLTGEEEKATVGGQAWAERMLKSSPGVQSFLRWVPTLLLPGVFLCMGAFVYYLRRA
jgi:hypothetical protein